jgi:hypothetical protein
MNINVTSLKHELKHMQHTRESKQVRNGTHSITTLVYVITSKNASLTEKKIERDIQSVFHLSIQSLFETVSLPR